MKVIGSLMSKRAFMKLWRLSGKPELAIIKPIAAWTLPAGVSYDSNLDRFVDGSGRTANVGWASQPALTVGFLANPQRNDVSLEVPGVTTVARTNVTLLWSVATQAALAEAWGIVISGKLYRIKNWELIPLGVSTPNSIDVELVDAGK
jgi:hypothetical protein